MFISKSLTKPNFTQINNQSTFYKKIGLENWYYNIIIKKLKYHLLLMKDLQINRNYCSVCFYIIIQNESYMYRMYWYSTRSLALSCMYNYTKCLNICYYFVFRSRFEWLTKCICRYYFFLSDNQNSNKISRYFFLWHSFMI